ncbi:MAG: DNA translocase FtsK [Planctomycetota bacterium]
MSHIDDDIQGDEREDAGLELAGIVLFLAGSLPAAAVAKALWDGTDLTVEGLGGTAALAALFVGWVGPWPALLVATTIAAVGAMKVLGTLRGDVVRIAAGVCAAGLGLAAIASAVTAGAGGRLGDGTGGALASALGSFAGVLLGVGVLGAAYWIGFRRDLTAELAAAGEETALPTAAAGPFDEVGPEDRAAAADAREGRFRAVTDALSAVVARAAALPAALRERRAARAPLGRSVERRARVSAKRRRPGGAQTLGAALVRDDIEGVSHDEAAALAPDDKTLAYMEEVWRRASKSMPQTEPVPPSPYPEDVRLKGEIPQGTVPFLPLGSEAAAQHAVEDGGAVTAGAHVDGAPEDPFAAPLAESLTEAGVVAAEDVRPFDFDDELGVPTPMQESSIDDPFGVAAATTRATLSGDDVAALGAAVLREGAEAEAPSELPPGVRPLAADAPSVADLLAETAAVDPAAAPAEASEGAPAQGLAGADPVQGSESLVEDLGEVLLPPPPAFPAASWEQPYEAEDTATEPGPIPDVDESGRWPRREDEAPESASELDVAAIEPEAPSEPGPESVAAAEEVPEPAPESPVAAAAKLEAPEAEEEMEALDEDVVEELSEEVAEDEEGELEDDEEYEYVDEDGNPIDPEELAEYETEDGEEAEDEEDEEEEAEYAEEDEDEPEDAEYEYVYEYEDDAEEDEDGDEPAAEDAEDDADYEEVEAEDDAPDIVLEPQAPPAGASREATRILEAGRIVVREGRVAVSLLQRELEMEFDEACELLDQLQDEGLIGPYKGGKTRDILLSEAEWEGRFVRS